MGFKVSRTLDGGEVEMTSLSLPPSTMRRSSRSATTSLWSRLSAVLRSAFRRCDRASSRRGTIGGSFPEHLDGDYEGVAYPVNRKGESVAGVRGSARSWMCRIESTSP